MRKLIHVLGAALVALPLIAAAEAVDINRAGVEELAAGLTGVGEARAAAIVAYREAHGPFTAPEQLMDVDGIGATTLEANRDRLRVE